MHKKLLTTKQYKLDKGLDASVLTAGITLSPAGEAGEILKRKLGNTCPMAGACAAGCLKFAGMNQYPSHAVARATRTAFYFDQRSAFLAQAIHEYRLVAKKAAREGMLAAGRPNLLSDLPMMAQALADALPNIQFYDYTKIPQAWKRTRTNYHLTYSASERSTAADIRDHFAHGINVAVVVSDVAKGEPLPATFTLHGVTRPAIDGDENDIRFRDAVGVFVLLRWKGSRARLASATASDWAKPTIPLTLVH